ncbi:MAG: pyridoxal phosphate-dependent aminotransferase [Cytophagales bacterium]|nr:pyridoxal phosphate-dependent aminotransferase [Cytophagales bacterium]
MDHLLSDRVKSLAKSATIMMAQKANALKEQGVDIINLSLGEPSFKTPKHIQAAAKCAIDTEAYFSYPPVAGYDDLRTSIAQKLQRDNGIDCEPQQIVVSTGAKQALANVFLCLLNPGDEVIVYTPYWVSYEAIIKLAGGQPVFIRGKLENDFKATPEQLECAITPKTKAVIFSSPCNPTGAVFSKQELAAMAAVLSKHESIFVIADEIYEYINFTEEHTSIASFEVMKDRTITVNGFSKGFAMTGWRVGYIAAPIWLAKACEKIQGQLTSATCSIAQRAALAAIEEDLAPTLAMTEAYRKRRDLTMELLCKIPGFQFSKPAGAFYLFPDVSYYFGKTDGRIVICNANDFCMYILQKAHVSLVTGSAFGEPHCVRLSYAASETQLEAALQRIKEALLKLKVANSIELNKPSYL